jgi:hypothetical protein
MHRTTIAAALAALLTALPAHAQRIPLPDRTGDTAVLDTRVRELETQIGQLLVQVEDLQRVSRTVAEPAAPDVPEVIGFTDQGGTLVLEWGGARIAVGSSGITLQGNDLTLVASGDLVVDSARDLSLQAGMDGTWEAGQSLGFKASGSGTFEAAQSLKFKTSGEGRFESAATLDLKGSTVKLNGGNNPIAHQGSDVAITVSGDLQTGPVFDGEVEDGSATVFVP